jgi:hypothetical protein
MSFLFLLFFVCFISDPATEQIGKTNVEDKVNWALWLEELKFIPIVRRKLVAQYRRDVSLRNTGKVSENWLCE